MKYTKFKTLALASAIAGALAACGGGGGGTSLSPSQSSAAAPTSMTGTVAVGNALVGANVLVIDSTGKKVTTTSGTGGTYTVSIAGFTAPFLIIATDPNGVSAPLYSVSPVSTTTNGAAVTANVTPITTAITAQLTSDGNPADLTVANALTSSAVNMQKVSAAVSQINTALSNILQANGLSSNTFDPIGSAFTPNQQGADAVIDSITVTASASGGLQLASVAPGSASIALGTTANALATAPAVTNPPVQANYLGAPATSSSSGSGLLGTLDQCLNGSQSACASAIDTQYLDNGYGSSNGGFQAAHANLSATGSTITGYKTLQFFAAGSSPFANVSGASALVRILYTNAAGLPGSELTAVQQLSDKSWNIIGNQAPFDVTINSFAAQRQFLDTADAPYSRYEAGLNIEVPTTTPPNTQIGFVSVSGPGITSPIWLEPRSATGNDKFALTTAVQTGVPLSGSTSTSNTTLYRWSWQSMPGAAATYAPKTNALGYYSPSPLTTTTLPAPFATYMVTAYDTTGVQLGSPFKVINSTPPLLAPAAQNVVWQTLASDVIANFLTPGGSLAGAQSTANVDWSSPNASPLVTSVQIQSASTTEVDGWWMGVAPNVPSFQSSGQYMETVTAGVNQSNVQQSCSPSPCQFVAFQASNSSRLVQLDWKSGGTNYFNIWKYQN